MADSGITKRALAAALKELMEEQPFAKISIGDICQRCDMNRKSFYYHFKDKYDLVNWIFDTEFIAIVKQQPQADFEGYLGVLCRYFYENRLFYRKALAITGQNSFVDHFRELLAPAIEMRLRKIMPRGELHTFQVEFVTEGVVGAIQRWIVRRDCMNPDEFLSLMHSVMVGMAIEIHQRYVEGKEEGETQVLLQ